MHLGDLLAELGSRLNLGHIELSDEGTCRLTFDKDTAVDFEQAQDPDYFHMYSVLAAIPASAEPVFRRLLAGNPFGQGTGHAVLGIDPETDEILMTRTLKADDTDSETFIKALESFVSHAEHWKRELSGPMDSDSGADDEPRTPPPAPSGMRV